METPLKYEKQLLRSRIKEEFLKYNAEELQQLSRLAVKKAEQSEWFAGAKKIACYHPLPDEVTITEFIEKWAERKEIYLPVILNGSRMELRRFNPGDKLCRNRYRIPEPLGGKNCNPDEIELFLVPGVAFDRSLYRLGRGKGYYDRLLAGTKAKKIGLCFSFQLLDMLPHGTHDVVMDAVFTPEKCIVQKQS